MDVFEELSAAQGGYFRGALLHAARELQLEKALPGTLEEIARKLRLSSRNRLRCLLEALVLYKLCAREGEVFHATFRDEPENRVTPGGWGELARVIREDRPLQLPQHGEPLLRYQQHLAQAGAAAARELWEIVPARGELLDLGGGLGTYAKAYPGESTLADTPEVLALSDNPRKLSINLATEPLPAGFGTILICNVLHLFSAAQAAQIVQKARNAARQVVIKDLLPGTPPAILFALNMALFTEAGDVHDLQIEGARKLQLKCSPNSLVLHLDLDALCH